MIDTENLVNSCYYLGSFLFIIALGGLSNQETARKGNWYGIFGMGTAILLTFLVPGFGLVPFIKFLIAFAVGGTIGAFLGTKVEMINMPQMVAALHSFVGIAATIIGFANYGKIFGYTKAHKEGRETGTEVLVEIFIGIFIGAITFSGSVVACGKLNGNIDSAPLILGGAFRHWLNLFIIIMSTILLICFIMTAGQIYMHIMCVLALFLGWHLIMAIGGADMPVVVSMLNSYSGWATSASGFMIKNDLLIISGALIGSSGAILSYIMCKAMNRGFFSVIMGGFGIETSMEQNIEGEMVEANTKEITDDLERAKSIIIIPGYGMAVAKAQNYVGQLVDVLRKMGKKARFCIHPVAGRLPGHMNVLLAEANVPYDIVLEKDEINDDFPTTDVVIVIGANDIVNPDALDNPKSPIAGMPVCECWNAKKCYIIKRGKGKGYAAIENPLFFKTNSRMYYGNADKKINDILEELHKRGLTSGNIQVKKEEKAEEHQEEAVEILTPPKNPFKTISIPKESTEGECRIAMVPKVCRQLVKLGFGIAVESNAGLLAGYSNKDFENAGAIIKDTQSLWKEADILIKINEPCFNTSLGKHEADALGNASILISFIWPIQNKDIVTKLQAHKGLTSLAVDQTPRITRAQKLDVRSSQMNLIGYKAALVGFNSLPRFSKQVVTAAGKFNPAKVFIIGCGVAGLAAIGMAKGMGAIVRAFDSRSEVKEQIESMGAEFVELDYQEEGAGGGGYGKVMSAQYYQAQEKMNEKICKESDIVVTTALIPGKKAPILVSKKVVEGMKRGSVVVDIAASQGGNCELTRKGEIYTDQETGVVIVGLTDSELSSSMASTASELFAVNMGHLLDEMIQRPLNKQNTAKNFVLDLNDEIIRGMAITHKGEFVYLPPQPPKPVQKVEETKKVEQKKEQVIISVGNQKDSQGKYFKMEDQQEEKLCETPLCNSLRLFLYGFFFTVIVGIFTNVGFIDIFGTFILAIFVGYLIIWNVTPALHTPLMSETNAISGIIVIGCMQVMIQAKEKTYMTTYSLLAFIGLFFASINVAGGFIVTHRMLGMFHK